jgi:hypothetical protein
MLNDTLKVVYGEIEILSYSWLIKIPPLSTSIFYLATLRCTMGDEKMQTCLGNVGCIRVRSKVSISKHNQNRTPCPVFWVLTWKRM